jgi:hypothetical protein
MPLNCVEYYVKQPASLLRVFAELFKKSFVVHESRKLILTTTARQWTPCSTSWIQSAICSTNFFRPDLILSLYLRLRLPSDPPTSGLFLAINVCISCSSYEYYMTSNLIVHRHAQYRQTFNRSRMRIAKPQLLYCVCQRTSLPSMKTVAPS